MTKKIATITDDKKVLYKAVLVGAILGILWFVLLRVVTIDVSNTHYHANFALYIDGERELFEEGTFYEEVAACGADGNDPLARVHMHELNPDVLHVHDASATWGNFFENLGFSLGDSVMYARTVSYVDGQDGELMFMLNGNRVRSLANRNITSEDTLLISFDKDTKVLDEQYQSIVLSAAEYNERADPASCSGSQKAGWLDRLKLVLGID